MREMVAVLAILGAIAEAITAIGGPQLAGVWQGSVSQAQVLTNWQRGKVTGGRKLVLNWRLSAHDRDDELTPSQKSLWISTCLGIDLRPEPPIREKQDSGGWPHEHGQTNPF